MAAFEEDSDFDNYTTYSSPEMIASRERLEKASHEIGTKLLQGWTMLEDSCPKPQCRGTPLMSHKKNSPGQKECVVCRTIYDSSTNKVLHEPSAQAPLVPAPAPAPAPVVAPVVVSSPAKGPVSPNVPEISKNAQEPVDLVSLRETLSDALDAAQTELQKATKVLDLDRMAKASTVISSTIGALRLIKDGPL